MLVTVVPSTDPGKTETALQAWEGSLSSQQPDTFVRAVKQVILMCIRTVPRDFTSQHHLLRNSVTKQSHKSLTRNKERSYTGAGSGDGSHTESKPNTGLPNATSFQLSTNQPQLCVCTHAGRARWLPARGSRPSPLLFSM